MVMNINYDVGSAINALSNKSEKASARAAAMQYKYNLALQQQSQNWNEHMYKNRYQMQVEDLEKAGINKLYGLGSAPSVTSGTNSIGMPDMVGEQNNKFQQAMSVLEFAQNLSARKAQTKLLENQANTEEINANLKTIEIEEKNISNMMGRIKLEYLPKKEKAEIENMISQSKANITQAQKNISDVQKNRIEMKAIGANTARTLSETRGIDANTDRTILETMPLKRYEEWVRKNPKLSEYSEKYDRVSTTSKLFKNIIKSGGTGLKYMIGK